MNAKATTSLLAILMLLPATTVLADTTGARTFYLPDDPSASMGEMAPSGDRSATHMQIEFRGGAPYARLTETLTSWTFIPVADAFYLHIAHRAALVPGASTFITSVDVFALGPDGQAVPVASTLATFAHPGGEIGDADGWTDIRFDADPASPLASGNVIALPPGSRLALEFSVRADPGQGLGAALADALLDAAGTIDESDILPNAIPGCTLAACGVLDPEAILLRQLTASARSNGENLDAATTLARVPASTFEVMDPADPARLVVRTLG